MITERMMTLFFGYFSVGLILVVSGIIIFFLYRNQNKHIEISHVHIVVMSLSTVISLTMGITLASLIDYHFFVSVLFGLLIGYVIGKPISLFTVVDGMIAGLMGGIMGDMTPLMVAISPIWLIIFMDILFIILMFIILYLIFLMEEEDKRKPEVQTIQH